ncbi:hypothetical protein BJ944DRAFT_260278 [Cunninghamella echinulata]|nr:hypothetical protein BJ944DRAFT_260278 [Cunninghamella echinulata]
MTQPTHQHQHQHQHHHTYNRDPIMEDEGFSLRFGNPINIIHNIQKHEPESFEPSHEPSFIVPTIVPNSENDTAIDSPLTKNDQHSSNATRDASSFADFYHQNDGTVNEIDH